MLAALPGNRDSSTTSRHHGLPAHHDHGATRLLNNIDHKDLRIDTAPRRRARRRRDVRAHVPGRVPQRAGALPDRVPQGADGRFSRSRCSVSRGQNLFLEDGALGCAPIVPLAIERQPFLIGRAADELMVHIDLDSPRVRQRARRTAVPRARRHHRIPGSHQLGAARHARGPGSARQPSSRRCSNTTCSNPSCSTSSSTTARTSPRRLLHRQRGAPARSSTAPRWQAASRRATCRPSTWSIASLSQLPRPDRAGQQARMPPTAEHPRNRRASIRVRCRTSVLESTQPVVLRGLVDALADGAGRRAGSACARSTICSGFYRRRDRRRASRAAREIGGRFFYNDDLSGFNFRPDKVKLDVVLDDIAAASSDDPKPPSIYVGSTTIDTCLPGFPRRERFRPRRAQSARQHLDRQPHAHRRAPGPAGQPGLRGRRAAGASRCSRRTSCPTSTSARSTSRRQGRRSAWSTSLQPDFERFPRFAEALKHAQVAELGPGDAVFIPSMWWHHIEALDALQRAGQLLVAAVAGVDGHADERADAGDHERCATCRRSSARPGRRVPPLRVRRRRGHGRAHSRERAPRARRRSTRIAAANCARTCCNA